MNLVLVISGLRRRLELVPFCLDRWRGPDDQDETVTIHACNGILPVVRVRRGPGGRLLVFRIAAPF